VERLQFDLAKPSRKPTLDVVATIGMGRNVGYLHRYEANNAAGVTDQFQDYRLAQSVFLLGMQR
jgi:hypothetical protein